MFSVNTTDLHVILSSNPFEFSFVFAEQWQLNVDGSPECCTEIRRTRSNITKMVIMGKFGFFLDKTGGPRQPGENSEDVRSFFHRDDSELVFFVYPDQESLGVIVENTSASWPFSVEARGLQKPIAFFEQEMIINELLSIGVRHRAQRVVSSSEVPSKLVERCHDVVFDLISLLLRDTWTEWEVCKVSANPDSGRKDHRFFLFGEWRAVELGVVHVADVSIIFAMSVVILNNSIKKTIKSVISVMTSSIDTDS